MVRFNCNKFNWRAAISGAGLGAGGVGVAGGIALAATGPLGWGIAAMSAGVVAAGASAINLVDAIKDKPLKDKAIQDLSRERGVLEERIRNVEEKAGLVKEAAKERDETAKKFKEECTNFGENVETLTKEREEAGKTVEELQLVVEVVKKSTDEKLKPLTKSVEEAVQSAREAIAKIPDITTESSVHIRAHISKIQDLQNGLKSLVGLIEEKIKELRTEKVAVETVYKLMQEKKENVK